MHCNSCGKTISRDNPVCEHCGRAVGGWKGFWDSLDTADFSKWLPHRDFWTGTAITAGIFVAVWTFVSYVVHGGLFH